MTKLDLAEQNGYALPREIGRVMCGLMRQFTTWGLFVGIDRAGCYERRYCFENEWEAIKALATYQDTTVHAPGPWIKVKGRFHDQYVDDLNPNLLKP